MPLCDRAMNNVGAESDHDDAQAIKLIFGGIVMGTTTNVLALMLGYPFLVALLCHSLFGILGMGLMLTFNVKRNSLRTDAISNPKGAVS